MAAERVERKLAAIVAADVAGYSRLMGADEEGTLAKLKAHRRELIDPKIAEHRGRIVKTTGDGILIEFPSVVDAVRCALEVQQGISERNAEVPQETRIEFRVGINLGDIIADAGDIHGDGVNIAARLEGLAEPGAVFVSGTAYDQVRDKLPCAFDDLGEKTVKNIARPVRVYRVAIGKVRAPAPAPTLSLPDKPSIAVLPFTNISGDAEQEYFADGLSEDLITDLSKVADLFVIARNSSFTYKGKPVDVRQVARELGVRYVLEGSARRASGRVRINAQLVDAIGGGHLWAERFDRDLADVFAVQDDVVRKIVTALVGELTAGKLPERMRPINLEAHDYLVRGRLLHGQSPEATKTARMLFEKAVALDPHSAEALTWLARSYWAGWMFWGEPADPYRALAIETAKRAVAADPNDAAAHMILGHVQLYERRWVEAAAEFETALLLNPNHSLTWSAMSELFVFKGRPDEAIDCAQKALRLDPTHWVTVFHVAQAQYAARRYDAAVETLRPANSFAISRRLRAASLAQLGHIEEARDESRRFMLSNPHFTVSYWASTQPYRDEAARQHFVEGYLKAGLPE